MQMRAALQSGVDGLGGEETRYCASVPSWTMTIRLHEPQIYYDAYVATNVT
jgi:hypothetical protein